MRIRMRASSSAIETKALRALGDENRMRIVLALKDHELCVCQLIELLGLAPSTVSKHLQGLKDAGIVDARKIGRWIYYRASFDSARGISKKTLELILEDASDSPRAKEDKETLARILKIDPEQLCERQRNR